MGRNGHHRVVQNFIIGSISAAVADEENSGARGRRTLVAICKSLALCQVIRVGRRDLVQIAITATKDIFGCAERGLEHCSITYAIDSAPSLQSPAMNCDNNIPAEKLRLRHEATSLRQPPKQFGMPLKNAFSHCRRLGQIHPSDFATTRVPELFFQEFARLHLLVLRQLFDQPDDFGGAHDPAKVGWGTGHASRRYSQRRPSA